MSAIHYITAAGSIPTAWWKRRIQIAAAKAPFFVNDLDGVQYLFDIAWYAAGKPDRTGWLLNEHVSKDAAVTRASHR